MLDSGAEVSASTTSSEPESGARSVSSIVRQWNRKINNFLGDPSSSVNGARPIRSGQGLWGWVMRQPRTPTFGQWWRLKASFLLCIWPVLNHRPSDRPCWQRVTDCHLGSSPVLAFHER